MVNSTKVGKASEQLSPVSTCTQCQVKFISMLLQKSPKFLCSYAHTNLFVLKFEILKLCCTSKMYHKYQFHRF